MVFFFHLDAVCLSFVIIIFAIDILYFRGENSHLRLFSPYGTRVEILSAAKKQPRKMSTMPRTDATKTNDSILRDMAGRSSMKYCRYLVFCFDYCGVLLVSYHHFCGISQSQAR